jgi:arylsulfatase A-like enzyme
MTMPPPVRLILARVVLTATVVGATFAAFHLASVTQRPIGVVIITLDTTRADRLSIYGLMDASMPALERLAREGVVFDQATTVAPLTLPAHTSLFTGLLPPRHGVRDNGSAPLADRETTLAETLHAEGFRTAAFVSSVVLDADRGLAQGFDDYSGVTESSGAVREADETGGKQRSGAVVIDEAVRWLEGVGDSRFFVWAHLYDPHRPYDPPEPYRSTYSDPYVGEIAFADAQIGRLLGALEQRGLLDRTIVIVAGDHGESLGDHGEDDHGIFVYESTMHVPLVIRAPGTGARRVGGVVRLTDVAPTVLELLGLPVPAVDGTSLTSLMTGRATDLDLEAYAESRYPERLGWSPLRSLRAARFKLIEAPTPELYDLDRDPFEEHNIYAERSAVALAMTKRLRVLAREETLTGAPELATVPTGLQERLAALGYIGSGRAAATRPASAPAPDPKDMIAERARQKAKAKTQN